MPDEGIAVAEAPVATPDFESMSVEQLEKVVDGEAAAPAKTEAPVAAETTVTKEAAQPPDELVTLKEKLAGLEREAPRWRAIQAQMQQFEAQKKAFERERIEAQRQQQLANLSPEDREQQDLALRQREEFSREVEAGVKRVLSSETYKGYIEAIDEIRTEKQDNQHLMAAASAAEELAPGSSAHVNSFWKKNHADLNSTNPEVAQRAIEIFDQASTNPHFLALEVAKSYMTDVRGKAAAEEKKRAAGAAQAGQTVGPGRQIAATSTKKANEMTQAELDALSIEELEKIVPEQ